MKIEKTLYKENMTIHYVLTDNKCISCKHSPENYCPLCGWDGKCQKQHESVAECLNFESINN